MFPPKTYTQYLRVILLTSFIYVIAFNIYGLTQDRKKILSYRKFVNHQIIGKQFMGLENFTRDIEFIGYYTDKDMADDKNAMEFSHAQYILAPSVLELNNLNHEYILFVCRKESTAREIIKTLNLKPLKRSPTGLILAKKQ